jgi:arylsulfatase
MLTGERVMPGPRDTFMAYGRSWAHVSNTPFREYKHWVHEGGIATPLIAHWPKGIAAPMRNKLVHQPGHVVDLMATCVDIAGATYPTQRNDQKIPPLEGFSLRPLFEGKTRARSAPIFFEHEGNRAVREGDWKLVAKGPAGPWELYNMKIDRTELHDLAAQEPDRVQGMVQKWEAWAHRTGALPWIWKPGYGDKEPVSAKQAESN